MNNLLQDNKKNSLGFALLILSLFIPLRFETSFLIIRPFDLFTAIFFLFLYSKKNYNINKNNDGFFYLFPFLIFHTFSSLFVGVPNFFREGIQTILIIFFSYVASNIKVKIDYKKIIYYLLIGSAILILYVILWHVNNNIFFNWKKLPDSRILYTIFPVLLFSYLNIIKNAEEYKFKIIFIFFILFFILLLSGERKAIVVFLFLFIMHYSNGFSFKIVIGLIACYFFLIFIANNIDNYYISKVLNSILNVTQTDDVEYVLSGGIPSDKVSYSNIIRFFIFDVSKNLFIENPLIGVGTNNFIIILKKEYSYLPSFLTISGIHNEFLRVLIENGLIGLFLYLMIWYKSWIRTKNILTNAIKSSLIERRQYIFILYSIYLTMAVYVGTEASSTRSFIILVAISLLPDFLRNHFQKKISK